MADKYILRVTAGPRYDVDSHREVPVNTPEPVEITSDLADIELCVRIQNYSGLPRNSPTTSPYFSTEPHATSGDQYSVCLRFTAKKHASADGAGIPAADLQFGNDFDRPIRDRLPPGFNTAMNIVKWWIDPGLDGDAYADKPYLFGAALSSFNTVHVGRGEEDAGKGGLWFEEGGDEAGVRLRSELGVPASAKERMRWALKQESKEKWTFEYGRTYGLDLFNPYLDFTNMAIRLPGLHLPVIRYWDGQPLRYVLRNRETGEVYLVVLFSLYLREDVNEDGTIKATADTEVPLATHAPHADVHHHEVDEEEALEEARRQLGPAHGQEQTTETSLDDVD